MTLPSTCFRNPSLVLTLTLAVFFLIYYEVYIPSEHVSSLQFGVRGL